MFQKYNSIEQFAKTLLTIKKKITFVEKDANNHIIYDPFLTDNIVLKFQGTVKIHGTNAGIGYDHSSNELWFQSRNHIITPEKDNVFFATDMFPFSEQLIELHFQAKKIIDELYPKQSIKKTIFFGEWAGEKVQKGVAISKLERMYILYDIKVIFSDGWTKWLDWNLFKDLSNPEAKVQNILSGQVWLLDIPLNDFKKFQNQLVSYTNDVENECPYAKKFGVSGVGEGIVWKCISINKNNIRDIELENTWLGDKEFVFKTKGSKHSDSKVKTIVEIDLQLEADLEELVNIVATETRFNRGIQSMHEEFLSIEIKNIGKFYQLVITDIIKEESTRIEESGFTLKNKKLTGLISQKSAFFYKNYLRYN